MHVKVRYFAMLREKAGVSEESVEGSFTSYTELYDFLNKKHGFDLPATMVQVAVNDEFTSMNASVEAESRVVFIPPVAGG
jgi:molybdopterin synthase sulfur carrier subunit